MVERMKIGTIICNHWAGDKNPYKYFIYLGIEGKYAKGVALYRNKLEKVSYYARDFNNREVFEPVGYCEGLEIMKKDLKILQNETMRKDVENE